MSHQESVPPRTNIPDTLDDIVNIIEDSSSGGGEIYENLDDIRSLIEAENLPELGNEVDIVVEEQMQRITAALENEHLVADEIDQQTADLNVNDQLHDEKIAKHEQTAAKLHAKGTKRSIKKARNEEWKRLGQLEKKAINERMRGDLTTRINEQYGVHKITNPTETALMDDMRGVNEEIAHRQKIEEQAQDPSLDPAVRALIETEIASWNGETLEEFAERRDLETKKKHKERLAKHEREEQLERFKVASTKLLERAVIIVQARSETDPAKRQKSIAEMSQWPETLTQLKQRLVGPEVDEFNEWLMATADNDRLEELKEAESKVAIYEKLLKDEAETRDKSNKTVQRMTDINKELLSPVDKDLQSQLTAEYSELGKSLEKLKTKHDQIVEQIANNGKISVGTYKKQLEAKADRNWRIKASLVTTV